MPPTYDEHKRFCKVDEWQEVKSARGRTPDHFRYRKTLANGDVLRTKVSHGSGEYGAGLWNEIWKRQLALDSEDQFWEALSTKKPVPRAADKEPEERTGIPTGLFWQLVNTLGMDEHEAAKLSVQEAAQKMTDYWASGGQ